MQIPKDAVLLRIFFGENDRFERQPLYEAIVLKAREMHLAGATVLRGPMGYGHSSRLPVLDTMMSGGLVTLEKVKVLRYGNNALRERGQSSAGRRRSRSPEGGIDR
jgi:PII-like signaling protein